ncbi:Protein F54E4.2 [Aphelenchoides avenae]|nr:Protein F54E4.2 [Aphelenchus avenae]
MTATFILAIVENSWLLLTVSANGDDCYQENSPGSKAHGIFDIVVSFAIPAGIVMYMDMNVLCCRMRPRNADPMLQIVINRPNGEKKKTVHHFLVITLSCLILNSPENALRLVRIISDYNLAVPGTLVVLAQAMYFSQFAFNAFYLATFVYDKSVVSKTNSSRQLSMTFRQRLEESTMIRERAHTMSYRATTPIPPLVRNSSCCALDELTTKKHWL